MTAKAPPTGKKRGRKPNYKTKTNNSKKRKK